MPKNNLITCIMHVGLSGFTTNTCPCKYTYVEVDAVHLVFSRHAYTRVLHCRMINTNGNIWNLFSVFAPVILCQQQETSHSMSNNRKYIHCVNWVMFRLSQLFELSNIKFYRKYLQRRHLFNIKCDGSTSEKLIKFVQGSRDNDLLQIKRKF